MRDEKDYTKKIDLLLWRRLSVFMKPYAGLLITLVLVMVLVAAIDAMFPVMTKTVIDNYIMKGSLDGLGAFTVKFLLMVSVQAVNVFLLIYLAGKIEMGISYDIRKRGFEKLQELSFSYFDRTPAGWVMSRLTSDTTKLGETISWGLVDLSWGAAMMAVTAVFMLVMNWKLALVVLAVIPPLAVVSMFYQTRILQGHRRVRKINSKISAAFNEGITGAVTTKTLVREEENSREFRLLTSEMRKYSVKTAVITALYMPVVLVLASIGTSAALVYGGLQAGRLISIGTLAAFISYTVQFFEPVREMARVLGEMQSAQAAGERILSLVNEEPDIKDLPEVAERYGTFRDDLSGKENPSFSGGISFRNVGFYYNRDEVILDNFCLDVAAGETVALVGETGSGKSTIVNLVCRFYEPVSGGIYIDGVEYRQRSLHWLHRHLGYVLQDPYLFSGTIRDNMRFGRPDAEDDLIRSVLDRIGALEFLESRKEGLDTEVGEQGNLLSSGERQLISIARAILAEPGLLILDEATSSVDTETEAIIQRAVNEALRGRTSFIIAHRLSTIREADRIVVLQKGRICEQGTHEQLLQAGGYYSSLYYKQFAEEGEEMLLRGIKRTEPGGAASNKTAVE